MVNESPLKIIFDEVCEKLKPITDAYFFEASQILEFISGETTYTMPFCKDKTLDEKQRESLDNILAKRLKNQPLQYILGEWDFYGIPLKVGEGVLIPRPDTENVVEQAINIINKNSFENVADLCSGSGAIALAIGKNTNAKNIYAVELSSKAYTYLIKNIEMNELTSKIKPVNEDVFKWIPPQNLDLIISNPPYIPKGDIPSLAQEVHFEPVMALDGGNDGLDFYRKLTQYYKQFLNDNGVLVYEIGINQAEDVYNIMEQNNFINIKVVEDYNGINRCVFANKN